MSRYKNTDFADADEFLCFELLGTCLPRFKPISGLDEILQPLILKRVDVADEDINECLAIWKKTFFSSNLVLDKPKANWYNRLKRRFRCVVKQK